MHPRRVLALCIVGGLAAVAPPSAGLGRGDVAPYLRLVSLRGDSVVVTDPAAPRPAVILFWASWCTNCRREIPQVNSILAAAVARGVPVHAVALRSDLEVVQRFVSEHAPGLPVLLDAEGETTEEAFSVDVVPTLVLVGASGRVERHGRIEPRRLAKQLDALVPPSSDGGHP